MPCLAVSLLKSHTSHIFIQPYYMCHYYQYNT